jgi:hypothetical protein
MIIFLTFQRKTVGSKFSTFYGNFFRTEIVLPIGLSPDPNSPNGPDQVCHALITGTVQHLGTHCILETIWLQDY